MPSGEQRLVRRVAVVTLHKAGWKPAAIARHLHEQQSFVFRWIAKEKGLGSFEDSDRSGRPKKITKPVVDKIRRLMKNAKHRSKRVVAKMLTDGGNKLSPSSVLRAAHSDNLEPKRPTKKPLQRRGNKYKRRKFAEEHKETDWNEYWFADEKKFATYSVPNRKNYVIWTDVDAPPPSLLTVAHGAKVNAYAAFSASGKSEICLFTENMNASKYIDILDSTLLPATDHLDSWSYLQDSAPTHTAKTVQVWLSKNVPDYIAPKSWPAQSPDLNPMENAWAVIGERVNRAAPKNLQELKNEITSAWTEVMNDEFRQKLVDSMPRRLRAVTNGNGHPTKY
jgi:transposase